MFLVFKLFKNMRVLIIEDDPDVSRFVEKGLKIEGFAVDVIDSGQIGLESAKANDYDLIVLDFYLPDMNGLEIARGIRKGKKHIPIIVLTGELQKEQYLPLNSLYEKMTNNTIANALRKGIDFQENSAILRKLFWHEIIVKVIKTVRVHLAQAKQELKKNPCY